MDRIRKIILYFFILMFLSGCAQVALFKETRILMDTFSEVSLYSPDRPAALKAMNEAYREMERIEKVFSKFDEKSEVSKINRLAGTQDVVVSSELFKIIERSLYYSKISGGGFDITVAPLVDIWGIARKNNSIPDAETIETTLKHIGYRNIVLNEEKCSIRFLDSAAKIDLGGIAKGYAVDRAKEILSSYGIESALINIGGNIFMSGSPPGKKTWQIGIQHPRNKNEIVYRLGLKDKAIATSGDYERFFTVDGKRFSHIIDPLTGRPSEGIMSVTIVSDSAERSDALSTAVFVMGPEKGLNLIRSLKDVEVLIFDKDAKLVKYP